MSEESILKILCLHGYRQNAESSRMKLGALRKLLKKHAELVFVSAPHLVPSDQGEEQRGWWFCAEDRTFNAHTECDNSVGLESTFELLEQVFQSQGPFQGVLGFSQGAALAAMLPSYVEEHPDTNIKFQCLILVAGFKSACRAHQQFYATKYTVPSLHVIGQSDQVIEQEMSLQLAQCFQEPELLPHPGGHHVPASSQQKDAYVKFLYKIKNKCS